MRPVGAALLALLVVEQAHAQRPAPCRTHPARVERCRIVHGRLSQWNGNPTSRIWIVGTHRMLGISQRPGRPRFQDLPSALLRAMGEDAWSVEVFGDFEVCPFTRQRPGWMQMVCVASARNLVSRRR